FIITLAPVFAAMWLALARRGLQISTPAKMTMGIAIMGVAFVPMILASRWENQPTSTPLDVIPPGVRLEEYGATRLRYDAATHTLQMNGVLTHLDRLKLLAASAPKELRHAVDAAVEQVKKKAEASSGTRWTLAAPIPQLPADVNLSKD